MNNHGYENLQRLVEAHPMLFEGFFPRRSSLPPGWYGLLDRLCTDIESKLGPADCRPFVVMQIKEKLAGLRFYYHHSDAEVRERVRAIVNAAESASRSACERCGAAARVRDLDGWLSTLCDVHHAEARVDKEKTG